MTVSLKVIFNKLPIEASWRLYQIFPVRLLRNVKILDEGIRGFGMLILVFEAPIIH